ncbi:MAG: DUF2227 family putative metal-binding protein [Cyanobacteriota bacterium]|jgi:uncharacterized metal-binding protein
MAMGRAHDRATTLLALPFGLLWGPGLGPAGIAVASLSFVLGGLWLSPDLDTPSRALARWGPLKPLWWPYRRLLRHRSLLSHSPLIGTGGRLAYLLAALALLRLVAEAGPWGSIPLPPLGAWPALVMGLWQAHPTWVLCALTGLEASSWLHLLQDGDPLPRVPRLLRRMRGLAWRRSPRRRRPARRSGRKD